MVEGINAGPVGDWLVAHVAGVTPPFEFSLIAGGHSNLTYRVEDAGGRVLVLRRPPLGHVLESANDMGREYRIISALAGTDVPVAPALGLCDDASVNGAPFYVMAFVPGTVMSDAAAARTLSEAERDALGRHVIEVLCNLHTLDVAAVGLDDLGRKEAYLDRQLRRWTRQWENSKTEELPVMEAVTALLAERKPEQVGFAIVHGDYRLGNMIARGGRLQAVLDWELCTLGDPLADLGYLLNSWIEPGEATGEQLIGAPTAVGGFPSREMLIEIYAERTGRDLGQIDYYRAFSHWRLAAIGQGVYKRYLVGAMGKDRGFDLDGYRQSVVTRAEAAMALLTES